jgi:hypothetical protein
MKKVILSVCVLSLLTALASCGTMKRDCQGRKHERLANGIYL